MGLDSLNAQYLRYIQRYRTSDYNRRCSLHCVRQIYTIAKTKPRIRKEIYCIIFYIRYLSVTNLPVFLQR